MVPRWGTLILLVVASGDAALLNRVAQALSARRVRDALIAPLISDAPTLAEPVAPQPSFFFYLSLGIF